MRVGEGDNKNCKILLHSSKTMKVLERVLSLLKAGSINLACVTYSYFHIFIFLTAHPCAQEEEYSPTLQPCYVLKIIS